MYPNGNLKYPKMVDQNIAKPSAKIYPKGQLKYPQMVS